ncbi:hypothetical protein KJ059_00130 [Myxococcota bacterium]|nr:hypothetical protein [Myxococcota bacterium]
MDPLLPRAGGGGGTLALVNGDGRHARLRGGRLAVRGVPARRAPHEPDGAALTPAGDPIRGLSAAGRTTACLAAPGDASGLSLGDGACFGRRAGRTPQRGA